MNMALHDIVLRGTTNGSGALTVNAAKTVVGFLYAVEWIDGTFDDGVGAVISAQSTNSGVAQTLLTLTNANDDKWYYPLSLAHKTEDGAALTGTAAGDRVRPIINGILRLVVSSGGDTKTGGCIVYITDVP